MNSAIHTAPKIKEVQYGSLSACKDIDIGQSVIVKPDENNANQWTEIPMDRHNAGSGTTGTTNNVFQANAIIHSIVPFAAMKQGATIRIPPMQWHCGGWDDQHFHDQLRIPLPVRSGSSSSSSTPMSSSSSPSRGIVVTLEAMARECIAVALSPRPYFDLGKTYVVHLGAASNLQTVIRRRMANPSDTVDVALPSPNICSSDKFQSYWIMLQNKGQVSVGVGKIPGKHCVASLDDSVYHELRSGVDAVKYVGLGNSALGKRARDVKVRNVRVMSVPDAFVAFGGIPVTAYDAVQARREEQQEEGQGKEDYENDGIEDALRMEYSKECEKAKKRAEKFGIEYKQPQPDAFFSWSEARRMRANPERGFITGFNIMDEKEQEKQRKRKERFEMDSNKSSIGGGGGGGDNVSQATWARSDVPPPFNLQQQQLLPPFLDPPTSIPMDSTPMQEIKRIDRTNFANQDIEYFKKILFDLNQVVNKVMTSQGKQLSSLDADTTNVSTADLLNELLVDDYKTKDKTKITPKTNPNVIDWYGSFLPTDDEEKFDFGDMDENPPVPMFPEDFTSTKSGSCRRPWPLGWWGIIPPSDELLYCHDGVSRSRRGTSSASRDRRYGSSSRDRRHSSSRDDEKKRQSVETTSRDLRDKERRTSRERSSRDKRDRDRDRDRSSREKSSRDKSDKHKDRTSRERSSREKRGDESPSGSKISRSGGNIRKDRQSRDREFPRDRQDDEFVRERYNRPTDKEFIADMYSRDREFMDDRHARDREFYGDGPMRDRELFYQTQGRGREYFREGYQDWRRDGPPFHGDGRHNMNDRGPPPYPDNHYGPVQPRDVFHEDPKMYGDRGGGRGGGGSGRGNGWDGPGPGRPYGASGPRHGQYSQHPRR
mmetsp:Transcript_14597/g.27445  ORF Transcript_14597/g.27445 Transcript_14597/m.27445 type:complete len:881 (+) Transcript_14597:76-2718(+)